jgi:hypothetical protein
VTVAELIAELQGYSQDMEVVVVDDLGANPPRLSAESSTDGLRVMITP